MGIYILCLLSDQIEICRKNIYYSFLYIFSSQKVVSLICRWQIIGVAPNVWNNKLTGKIYAQLSVSSFLTAKIWHWQTLNRQTTDIWTVFSSIGSVSYCEQQYIHIDWEVSHASFCCGTNLTICISARILIHTTGVGFGFWAAGFLSGFACRSDCLPSCVVLLLPKGVAVGTLERASFRKSSSFLSKYSFITVRRKLLLLVAVESTISELGVFDRVVELLALSNAWLRGLWLSA